MQDSILCCGRLPPCLGLIRLYAFILPDTPVGPPWINSHYQCPTHVGLPLTVLVAHWPQQGTSTLIHCGLRMDPEQLLGICSTHMRLLRVCLILRSEKTVTTMYLSCSECRVDHSDDPYNISSGTTLQCTGKLCIHALLISQIIPCAAPMWLKLYKTKYIHASDTTDDG